MSTLEDRIQEAHDNFINGRFINAARILQSPIQTFSESSDVKDYLDSLYMSHFRLVALHRADNTLEFITTLINTSQSLLQFASKVCMQQVGKEGVDVHTKIEMLKISMRIFSKLNMQAELVSIKKSLISTLMEQMDSHDEKMKIRYMNEVLNYLSNEDKRYTLVMQNLTAYYEEKVAKLSEYNVRERQSGGRPKDIEEATIYLELASIYRNHDILAVRDYLKKAFTCTTIHIFHKFGFPKFKSVDEIENYRNEN